MRPARTSRGFSLIELMAVLTIVSVLVRMSLPAFATYRRQAVAAQAMNDFHVVQTAAYAQYEATGSFPPDAPSGFAPPGSVPFLPRGFSFRRPEYELDWDQLAISDSSGSSGYLAMLTVVTPDSLLGYSVIHRLGSGTTHWSVGDAHTFVIATSVGSR